jgi:hypothetical protein
MCKGINANRKIIIYFCIAVTVGNMPESMPLEDSTIFNIKTVCTLIKGFQKKVTPTVFESAGRSSHNSATLIPKCYSVNDNTHRSRFKVLLYQDLPPL